MYLESLITLYIYHNLGSPCIFITILDHPVYLSQSWIALHIYYNLE